MGWPVCLGAHPYRGTRAAKEPGRACSCDRVGCPAPGAHPVSPAWQIQATVDPNVIRSWWETRPEANVILVTGRVFDVLDVPAAAGSAALGQMEAAGAAVGPVAGRPGADAVLRGDQGRAGRRGRMVVVRAGLRAGELPVGLRWHCRDSYVLAPPSHADGLAARWLRAPQEHPLPDALRLLEYLVDACEA